MSFTLSPAACNGGIKSLTAALEAKYCEDSYIEFEFDISNAIDLFERDLYFDIERCYVNNNRLRRLLNDVSLITRMEDGGQLITRERVIINDIIEEISDEMEMLPNDERFYLHIKFPEKVKEYSVNFRKIYGKQDFPTGRSMNRGRR